MEADAAAPTSEAHGHGPMKTTGTVADAENN